MAKIKAGKWEMDEEEFDRQYKVAVERGRRTAVTEPRAVAAHYDRDSDRLVIDLSNGATLILPVSLLQGFKDAQVADIAAVEVVPNGSALHWEKLDADFSVPGLVAGVFGNRAWMDELRREWGRKGGKAKSDAKAAAARANGTRGGRPRKLSRRA